MNSIRKFILKTLLGKGKNVAELKVEISNITSIVINEIKEIEIPESSIIFLSQLMLNQGNLPPEAFKTWSDSTSNSLIPKSAKKTDEFLYDRRWDIALLNKKDHMDLRKHMGYSSEVCTSLIEDKVTSAIEKAEALAMRESMLNALLIRSSDETVH